MAEDYAEFIALAIELIEENGREMQLVLPSPKSARPAYPGAPKPEQQAAAEPIALFGVETHYESKDIDGTAIQSGDVKLLFDARVPIPDDGRVDGFQIVSVIPVRYGEPVVYYKVQARR